MAYDIEGNNHFVLIVKFNRRYDEKIIQNTIKLSNLEENENLCFVEKFKMPQKEDKTKFEYFAVFQDKSIPWGAQVSRHFISKHLDDRLNSVVSLINHFDEYTVWSQVMKGNPKLLEKTVA